MEHDDNSPLIEYLMTLVQRENLRKTRGRLREGLRLGLIEEEALGIEPPVQDVDDYMFDNDDADESEFGMPVFAVQAFSERMDYEWLIMSLPADHAKVVLVRHFGMRGKRAARAAGFSSEWSLYRREHEFKKTLERQREHFMK